jgi:hypothetical protein
MISIGWLFILTIKVSMVSIGKSWTYYVEFGSQEENFKHPLPWVHQLRQPTTNHPSASTFLNTIVPKVQIDVKSLKRYWMFGCFLLFVVTHISSNILCSPCNKKIQKLIFHVSHSKLDPFVGSSSWFLKSISFFFFFIITEILLRGKKITKEETKHLTDPQNKHWQNKKDQI